MKEDAGGTFSREAVTSYGDTDRGEMIRAVSPGRGICLGGQERGGMPIGVFPFLEARLGKGIGTACRTWGVAAIVPGCPFMEADSVGWAVLAGLGHFFHCLELFAASFRRSSFLFI